MEIIAFLLAIIGHIICGVTDCLLGYSKQGRLNLIADPEGNMIEIGSWNKPYEEKDL